MVTDVHNLLPALQAAINQYPKYAGWTPSASEGVSITLEKVFIRLQEYIDKWILLNPKIEFS